jgi:hypothetical protein
MRKYLAASILFLASCSFNPVDYSDTGNLPSTGGHFAIRLEEEGREAQILRINSYVGREIARQAEHKLRNENIILSERPDFILNVRLESEWDPRVDAAKQRSLKGLNNSVFPDADPRARTYQLRKLVMEVTSPDGNEVYWQGVADGVLNEKIDGGRSQLEAARKLIDQLVKSRY